MAGSASPTPTSGDLEQAARRLAHVYLRKGGKQSRRKRVDRLCLALRWIGAAFPACRGLDQVGRKQVWRFYAAHGHLSAKTQAEYGYAFRLLWELLGRTGLPPWPVDGPLAAKDEGILTLTLPQSDGIEPIRS